MNHPPDSCRGPLNGDAPFAGRRAFTLLELLTVLAIVGIIAAVLLGSANAARERTVLGQTRVELAVLAQALEAYKAQYGDYPRTNDSAALLQALVGKANPAGAPIAGRSFLELAKLHTVENRDPFADASAQLADPRGHSYQYFYAASWRPPSFALYSVGKDGLHLAPDAATGEPHFNDALNVDNLYAGRD